MSDERDGTVGEVIDRRVQVYGDPTETFARIAEVWSGILGHQVNAVEVPLMMMGLKLVRAQVMPDYSDNTDDVEGYLDIFRQIVGPDMISARSVNEFIELKWGCKQPASVYDEHADDPNRVVVLRQGMREDVDAGASRYVHTDGPICRLVPTRGRVLVGGDPAVYTMGGLCPLEHPC